MKILAITLLSLGAVHVPATPTINAHLGAVTCSSALPDSYRRPGGYCDQIEDNNSIAPTDNGPTTDNCRQDALIDPVALHLATGQRLLLAGPAPGPCYPCHGASIALDYTFPVAMDRLHVAVC